MAVNKKPRKPMRKTWNAGGVKLKAQPWKMAAAFRPIENILSQIEDGDGFDVVEDDIPVFRDMSNGELVQTSAAIYGMVEAFEIHEARANRDLQLDALRVLADKMDSGEPIYQNHVREARAAVRRLRAESAQMTAEYASQMVRDFQTMEELRKVSA